MLVRIAFSVREFESLTLLFRIDSETTGNARYCADLLDGLDAYNLCEHAQLLQKQSAR